MDSLLNVDQGQGYAQCGISYSLQLRPGLHQGDQTETGDENKGTPRCLQAGNDGKVSCSRAYVGESPSIDWEETTVLDHGRGQELLVKEAVHIQMTPSGHPQRSTSTGMEDWKFLVAETL